MKKSKVWLCISLMPIFLVAQVDTVWVRRFNGQGDSTDCAVAIAIDNSGNVYVTGYSFYPNTNLDYLTIKYSSSGQELWQARYDGLGNNIDYPYALTIDNRGYVYVTGGSWGGSSFYDCLTIKYNSNGETIWTRRYNGPGNNYDEARAIAVDNYGNVYVAGRSYGSTMTYDCLTIKYDSLGQELWTARYNGPGNSYDAVYAMIIDNQGNVYITGTAYTTNYDYLTIKYNSSGQELWVQTYNGLGNSTDYANAITLDQQGNVYVTGNSYGSGSNLDYLTIKYSASGQELWTARYNGPGNYIDHANDIGVDHLGNVYVAGACRTLGAGYDYATIKYDSLGQQQWVQIYNSGAGDDYCNALVLDSQSNIYVTGYGTYTSSIRDYTTIKYNTQGQMDWIIAYDGLVGGNDDARAIAIDNQGNVYVTGESYGSGTGYDYATIKYAPLLKIEEARNTADAQRLTLKIYPNPATSVVRVRAPFSVDKVTIYDVTGKIVKEVRNKKQETRGMIQEAKISTDGIKRGIYFLRVNGKIVKEKLIVVK
ncbi:MAG: SBBP repeat-containing protein [candidate division WOR-3 bacterium]